jgi:hypothetical protein
MSSLGPRGGRERTALIQQSAIPPLEGVYGERPVAVW